MGVSAKRLKEIAEDVRRIRDENDYPTNSKKKKKKKPVKQ